MVETILLYTLDATIWDIRKSIVANNPTKAFTGGKERKGGEQAYGLDQWFSNYETSFLSRDSSGHQRGSKWKLLSWWNVVAEDTEKSKSDLQVEHPNRI